ncbi:LysR family transcriptional regulator [Adhaeretor mobilis]|nr:LysR family transcriptional regulator [Adhaeretor mobilis]
MIELRDLQNLLSIDAHRHFGRAAEAVGLSQSALTKSLQRLEKELGVRLFDRSSTRVEPTTVGQEVLDRANQIALGVTELQRSVDLLRGVKIGAINVGVGPAMAESHLSSALARLVDEHPLTRISVRVDHWQQLSAWLLSGEIDLFIADLSESTGDERIESIPLPAEEIAWYCRAGHPLAERDRVSRSDLVRFPIVSPRFPQWAINWFAAEESSEGPEERAPLPTLECENYAMLKRIVLSSDSISAALPTTIRYELEREQVVILPVDAPKLVTHAGVAYLRHRSPSPLVTKAIEVIMSLASRA